MNSVQTISQGVSVAFVGKMQWKLKDFLEQRDISTYRLAQELERSKAPNLYRLVSKKPEMIGLSTLTSIIEGLRKITGEDIKLTDLLDYSDEPN